MRCAVALLACWLEACGGARPPKPAPPTGGELDCPAGAVARRIEFRNWTIAGDRRPAAALCGFVHEGDPDRDVVVACTGDGGSLRGPFRIWRGGRLLRDGACEYERLVHDDPPLNGPTPRPAGPVDCAALVGIAHDAVEVVAAGAPIRILAHAGDSLAAARTVLHYRYSGQAVFTEVPMERTGTCDYEATITLPKAARFVHYFITASDGQGKALAYRGRPSSPYLLQVEERP